MAKQYWLMKSEPDVYSWDTLVQDGSGIWDGVRNHTAKLNMQAMKVGDEALFYHSNIGKECVGIMKITEAAFPDPTAEEGSPWVVVRVEPEAKIDARCGTPFESGSEGELVVVQLLARDRRGLSGPLSRKP